MNRSLRAALTLGLVCVGTALATPPPVSPGDGGNIPAAPEPNLILMVVAGLVLLFGYVLWRRRQLRAPTNS